MMQHISISLSRAASSLTCLGERETSHTAIKCGKFIVLSRVLTVMLQLLQPYKYHSLELLHGSETESCGGMK